MATTHNKKEELKQSFKDFLDKETLKLSDSISDRKSTRLNSSHL